MQKGSWNVMGDWDRVSIRPNSQAIITSFQTEPMMHDDGIAQGLANSNIPVKGHHHPHATFCCTKTEQHRELNDTACVSDALVWPPQVRQHLRHSSCGEAEIQEGKIAKKEVHGSVETRVHTREQDNG